MDYSGYSPLLGSYPVLEELRYIKGGEGIPSYLWCKSCNAECATYVLVFSSAKSSFEIGTIVTNRKDVFSIYNAYSCI